MVKVFFSSCFTDPAKQSFLIREKIRDEINGPIYPDQEDGTAVLQLPLWMAEDFPHLNPGAMSSLEQAHFCAEGVRQSDIYVAVIRSNHGSGIELDKGLTGHCSYFEIELFQAAAARKPTYIFVQEGAQQSDKLNGLLNLLDPCLPGGIDRTPLTERQIIDKVKRIVDRRASIMLKNRFRNAAPNLNRLVERLRGSRKRLYSPRSQRPPIRFLGGRRDVSVKYKSITEIREIFCAADHEPQMARRLDLLWIGLRELLIPGLDAEKAELLQTGLSAWANAGAWAGLHGHQLMGCFAALAEITHGLGDICDAPHGALASEHYSIARLLTGRVGRRDEFDLALDHVNLALEINPSSNELAIRGSIYGQLGAPDAQIADYRAAWKARTGPENASQAKIGEAKAEWGFAEFMRGNRTLGISLMEEGVNGMNKPDGFLIRAKRKLGRAYLRVGSLSDGLDQLEQARAMAVASGMSDQVSILDTSAARVAGWMTMAGVRRTPVK